MLLIVENGSIFTPNIVDTLSKTETEFNVIPFDAINDFTLKIGVFTGFRVPRGL